MSLPFSLAGIRVLLHVSLLAPTPCLGPWLRSQIQPRSLHVRFAMKAHTPACRPALGGQPTGRRTESISQYITPKLGALPTLSDSFSALSTSHCLATYYLCPPNAQ